MLSALERPADGFDGFLFPARRRRQLGQNAAGDTASDIASGDGVGLPIEDLRGPWQRVRQAAGMPELRMHDLRHTFASMGAAGGLSLQLIGGLLGHASIRTTQRYAHLVDAAQRDGVERIGADLARAVEGKPRAAPPARR